MDTPARKASFELLLADYRAMSRQAYAPGRGNWPIARLSFLGAFVIGAFVARSLGRDALLVYSGVLIGFSLMSLRFLVAMRRLQPRPGGSWLCQYDVQLTDGGVHVQTPRWTCDLPWHGVLSVEETASHCFLRLDASAMYTIPKRAFASDEALQQFVDFAHECVSRSRKTPTASA